MQEIHWTGSKGGPGGQLTLDGEQLKEAGTEAALRAFPGWSEKARQAAMLLLGKQETITSEDVTEIVGYPGFDRVANAQNAIGAVFSALSKQGLIRRVGYVQARNPSAHGRTISKWTRRT